MSRLAPFTLAAITATLYLTAQKGDPAVAQALLPKPKITVSYNERPDKVITLVGIEVPSVPGFACDVWCYEQGFDNRQRGEAEPQPDGSMILTHTRGDTTVKTHIVPGVMPAGDGGPAMAYADFNITVSGKTKDDVMAVTSLNPCWQMRRAEGFSSDGEFVENFVNQCFVFTEKGFTLLKETTRFPDTRKPADDERNSPPWVQNYLPVWRRHKGQPEAFWGTSTDRPIYSLVGEVSRDGKYLTAFGCLQTNQLGQGWHDCLHISPNLRGEYDEGANEIRSHWRMYFMENDPDRLLRLYLADFKLEPPSISATPQRDGTLALSSKDLPAQKATLALRVFVDGELVSVDAARQWRQQPWGALTSGGSGPGGRYCIWANPAGDHIDLVVSVANSSRKAIDGRIEAIFDVEDRSSLAEAGGVAGVLWEDGQVSADLAGIEPGEFKTLRGRAYLLKAERAELHRLQNQDLEEWRLAVPFSRALPE